MKRVTSDEGGDAYDHKYTSCALIYKFFEDDGKKLCEAECSYAYYYTIPFGYYECTETNNCPKGSSFLIPELRKCVSKCSGSGYDYTYAGKCYRNYEDANSEIDDSDKKTCKDKSGENDPRCAVSYKSFDSDTFINAEGIKAKEETYAKDFLNTYTHINYYNNRNAILVIYKDV